MRPTFLVIRLCKILSWLAVLAFMLYIYYYLPEQIAIHYNDEGVPDNFLNREAFFYVVSIFTIVLNVLLSLIGRMLLGVPGVILPVPNRNYWLADAERREHLIYVLRNWINSFAAALNVFILMMLFVTLRLHTNQRVFLSDFTWVLFVGLAILIGWAAYLPIRLRYTASNSELGVQN